MPQFADDSMTPSPLSVTRDKYKNEIPTDQTNHGNATPEMGAFHFDGKQYSTDFSSYGTSVDGSSMASSVTVDNSRADRGKDA